MEFMTATDLRKQRNWTPKLIKDFLGEPDEVARYRWNGKHVTSYRYSMERVHKAEAQEGFRSYLERMADRRAKASSSQLERARNERAKLYAEIEAWDPGIRRENLKHLRRAARDAWTPRNLDTWDGSTPNDLDRLTVNFLRHNVSGYDWMLDSLAGRVGKDAARDMVRERVLESIENVYPELKVACDKQRQWWAEQEEQRDLAEFLGS